jgi:hypothetical protein
LLFHENSAAFPLFFHWNCFVSPWSHTVVSHTIINQSQNQSPAPNWNLDSLIWNPEITFFSPWSYTNQRNYSYNTLNLDSMDCKANNSFSFHQDQTWISNKSHSILSLKVSICTWKPNFQNLQETITNFF